MELQHLHHSPASLTPLTPLSFLQRAATLYGDSASLVYQHTRFTWSETYDRCRRLAAALASRHIGTGDVVAVVAPNTPAMYELHYGVPMAGAVLNTLNTRLDAHTISTLLRHSGAKAVFVDYKFIPLVHESLHLMSGESTSRLPILVVIQDLINQGRENNSSIHGELQYENFLKGGDPCFQICWPMDEWQAITLNYTSGTTSRPKGVVVHHRGAYLSALVSMLMWPITQKPVYLWTVPMFHANGWCFTWSIACLGGTNICLRQVTVKEVYDAITKHKVTHLCCAPTVLNMIASASAHEVKILPFKVHILCGGSSPPPSILARMEELGFSVTHCYGLTESYGASLYCRWNPQWDSLPLHDRARLKARQGVPSAVLASADVKDPETMASVPHDGKSIGEIMVRGSSIMKCYLNDPEATQKAFEGGWLHTGDLGVIHSDGYIEVKDRSKDTIISGGENISSIEVESVLYSHPQILEAAVVARPDDHWGETPCAFIQLKEILVDSDTVSAEKIIAYCQEKLPHYMVPRTVIFGELPKTSTGKIYKVSLREKAKALGSLSKKTVSRL